MVSAFPAQWRIPLPGALILVVSMGLLSDGWAQQPGERIFQTSCFACHTIGGGRLVGPDLAGIHDNRSQDWLERFVKSSQTMISNGDTDAVALAEEYTGIVMPDAVISDQQIGDCPRLHQGQECEPDIGQRRELRQL